MEARGPGAGKEKRERGSEREKEREVSPKFYIVISEVIFDMQSDVYTSLTVDVATWLLDVVPYSGKICQALILANHSPKHLGKF